MNASFERALYNLEFCIKIRVNSQKLQIHLESLKLKTGNPEFIVTTKEII